MRIASVVVLGLIVGSCVLPRGGYKSSCIDLPYDECNAKMDREVKQREAQRKEREEQAKAAQALERQRAAEQAARLQARRAAVEKKYQETVAAYLADVKAQGYALMSFRDFQVDAANLAERHAKVAVEGRFLSLSEGGYLVESLVSIAIMRRTGQMNQGIPLRTNSAARGLRTYLIDCTSNAVGSQLGCPVGIYGTATMCTLTLFGNSRIVPCIEVRAGWHVPRPVKRRFLVERR